QVPHAHRHGRDDLPRPPGLRVDEAHPPRGAVDRQEQLRRHLLHPDRLPRLPRVRRRHLPERRPRALGAGRRGRGRHRGGRRRLHARPDRRHLGHPLGPRRRHRGRGRRRRRPPDGEPARRGDAGLRRTQQQRGRDRRPLLALRGPDLDPRLHLRVSHLGRTRTMTVHTPEQLAHEQRRYLQVFAWLVVLTAVELVVIYPHISPLAKGLTLVERSGRAVSAADLAGHVWVADFVFTHCPTFCPLLTERMAGLQKALVPAADPVRLVSFSVDPAHDTPEVLEDYARRAGAGEG